MAAQTDDSFHFRAKHTIASNFASRFQWNSQSGGVFIPVLRWNLTSFPDGGSFSKARKENNTGRGCIDYFDCWNIIYEKFRQEFAWDWLAVLSGMDIVRYGLCVAPCRSNPLVEKVERREQMFEI